MTTYEICETPLLTLGAKTAADLLVPNLVSVPVTATLPEAVTLLTEKRISAVPVLENGQPVGVLSLSDIVGHDCRKYAHLQTGSKHFPKNKFMLRPKETLSRSAPAAETEDVLVQDVMTPVVYSVAWDTPAGTVIDAMLSLGVHRLFVTDEEGGIIGVISTLDILRHLHRPDEDHSEPSDQKEVIIKDAG
jgi:CBS domain-containing protein